MANLLTDNNVRNVNFSTSTHVMILQGVVGREARKSGLSLVRTVLAPSDSDLTYVRLTKRWRPTA